MKLTLVFFLLALLGVKAGGFSQEVTISGKDLSLEKVFSVIEQQTGYAFFYNDAVIARARPVTVSLKKVTLKAALDNVLSGQGLIYSWQGKTIFIRIDPALALSTPPVLIPAISLHVSGRVTDENGRPLAGVSISLKNTKTGTSTDPGGSYELTLPDGKGVLLFSSVGYAKKEVAVNDRIRIDVTLAAEASPMEQLVVVGYGAVRRADLTSSVSTINSDAIRDRPIPTLGEALAGQLAGVRAQSTSGVPGAELQIRIRGINTIDGNSSPLYVIDGVPREDMSDINPADVASVQILKDASATAIYGARGANGVVLIETKQGTEKPAINFNALYGYQYPEKFMDMQNKDEWLAYHIWFRNEKWLRQGGSMHDAMSARPEDMRIPDEWLDPDLEGTDWQKAITSRAPVQSYQLSTSAKSDLGSIYISGGYLDQDGVIYNTYYKRMNFRVNGTLNIGKRIKMGISAAPSFSNQDDRDAQGKETVIHHALMQSPLVSLQSGTEQWGYPVGMGTVYPNPLEQLKYTIDNTRKNKLLSSIWGQVELAKGLVFKTQYSFDFRQDMYEFFQPGNVTYNNGFLSIGNSNVQSWNDFSVQNTLVYDKVFSRHTFNILLGQGVDQHRYFRIQAEASGWPNENISTLNVATTPTLASTDKSRYTGSSFFGRVNYSYDDRYLLNASIRRDGSSRFGPNNKWGVFPAVSAAWKISEESFMKEIGWLSLLKVRAAWGASGNDRIGDYDYMAKLDISNTSWGNAVVAGIMPLNIENKYLKWESTQTVDLGLDFSGFNNRVQIAFDYYANKTKNLLFNVPIPNTTGFSEFRTNLGAIRNKGWELDVTTQNTTGRLRWTTSFNLSANSNRVLDMGGLQQFTSSSWDAQFITRVGGPVAQYYVYRTNGFLTPEDFDNTGKALVPVFKGQEPGNVKYTDQNNDKKLNTDDLVPYGNNIPDIIYGMRNSLRWKNLELGVLIQGQAGGDVLFLGARQLDEGGGNINTFARWVNTWKPDYEALYGPGENPVPDIAGIDMSWDHKTPYKFGKNEPNSDLRIYDASFIRIKNILLGYNLPKGLAKGVVKSAKIFVSVDNLRTFDDYPGVTPETNSFGNTTTQPGVDYSTYPLSKKYTLGISLTF